MSGQNRFCANRGYALLQVDVRGSGGYESSLEMLAFVREHLDSAPDSELATP